MGPIAPTPSDLAQLETVLTHRIDRLFLGLEPTVVTTLRRLAHEIFRALSPEDLRAGDFWVSALRAQALVIAEILRRLVKHPVRDQDLFKAIEQATKLEIEGRLISRMTLATLLAPLVREDPHCVPVLIMKHAFGYTYDEICRETDLSVQQIRTLLSKALRFLQRGAASA